MVIDRRPNGDYVFEKKNTKVKAFAYAFIAGTIMVVMLLGVRFFMPGEKKDGTPKERMSPVFFVLAPLGGLVGGLLATKRVQDISILVSQNDVDVTIGKKHGTYPVSDYICPELKKGGNNSVYILNLVFKNPDPDAYSNLYIQLPGVNRQDVLEVSDHIIELQKKMNGTIEEHASFAGKEYSMKPTSAGPEKNFKFAMGAFMVMEVFVLGAMIVLTVAGKIPVSYGITGIVLAGLAFLISIGSVLYIMKKMYSERQEGVSITFDDSSLKILRSEFSHGEIKELYMTPPYLQSIRSEVTTSSSSVTSIHDERRIIIRSMNSEKPQSFYAGDRPYQGYSEESVSENAPCPYPAIYARMKEYCEQHNISFSEFQIPN